MNMVIKKWFVYLQERSPLAALGFISSGIVLSSMAYVEEFKPSLFMIGLLINTLLFIQMRLGDEIKDLDKDRIIHPDRPLPRGLLTVTEVMKVKILILVFLLIASLLIAINYSWIGGLALGISTVFAWLMFREFYIGKTLNNQPMLYAFSHQLIVFPIHAWVALAMNEKLLHNSYFQGWLLANFGASFTFEICRKLDPSAHKLAQTYAHHYGRKLTVAWTALFISISAYGVQKAHLENVACPILLVLLISLILWMARPKHFKLVAALSTLSSIIILWSPAVKWLISVWS